MNCSARTKRPSMGDVVLVASNADRRRVGAALRPGPSQARAPQAEQGSLLVDEVDPSRANRVEQA